MNHLVIKSLITFMKEKPSAFISLSMVFILSLSEEITAFKLTILMLIASLLSVASFLTSFILTDSSTLRNW